MPPNPYDEHLDKNPANYQPLTPLQFLQRAALIYPNHTAIIHGQQRFTYAQFYARCRRLASALVARGIITAEEAAQHPGRHTLREAVMGHPLTLIDEGRRALAPGDRLLVCSDGVLTLEEADIMREASKPVQRLVDAVLALGMPRQDNVTIIKLEQEV